MKNRILFVFLAMVLVVSLAAFAACKAEEEEVVEEGWQWPDSLMVGTTGVGGQSYVVAIAWSTPMADDTGMTVRVVVQPDMNTRYRWLVSGLFFTTTMKQMGKPWIYTEQANATRDGGPAQLRGWVVSGKRDKGWATTPDTGIKTPHDIKPGTRIVYSAYLGPVEMHEYLLGLIAWAQVDQEDIEWVPASSKSAITRLLMDGRADIAYGEETVSAAWYEVEAAPRGLAWLDLDANADPEGAARYSVEFPDATFAPITFGVPSSVGRLGMTNISFYVVMEDQDPELVYQLAKWLTEKHDLYKDNHPVAESITIDNLAIVAETHYIPVHEGIVRYLKDLGLWTPTMETRRQYNIDLIGQYIEAWNAALLEADKKGIEVDPKNNEWIELWYSYRDPLPVMGKIKQPF